ncbi:MAG TPA: dUTP diphosphatase [Vicinamibacterales bacterium]
MTTDAAHVPILEVGITRCHPDAVLPSYQTPGSAAFDLTTCEEVRVEPGAVARVRTGLIVQVPPGYFLAILARSSTPGRWGVVLANSVGVVDSDYRGPGDEVAILVHNIRPHAVTIPAGTRLAQGMVLPVPRVRFVEREAAGESRGGFGSTG